MLQLACACLSGAELGPHVDWTSYDGLCCAKPLTVCGPHESDDNDMYTWLELGMYI
jgi:hypothetical protein